VVNVASAAQEPVDLDDIMFDHGYTGPSAYARSKFAMVAARFALARRLNPDVVTVNSLHPGSMMPTKMVVAHFGPANSGDTLESGVDAVDRLASDPALAGVTGRYFVRMTEGAPHPRAHDHQMQERLWELLLKLTGAPDPAAEISGKRRSWT
jgi:NAD(P)-dependent dehydrogenase (short-subunit alcohol dehydrogenase family)